MKIDDYIKNYFSRVLEVQILVRKNCLVDIKRMAMAIFETYYKRGGSVFLFGNGGSASCAEHIAEELLNRLKNDRIPIAAYALTSQPAIITGIANDYGFDKVFSRQVEALATPKDVVIGLSTSGSSKNVLAAVKLAKTRGVTTVGMTGLKGVKLMALSDIVIKIPSVDVSVIQEAHMSVGHVVCAIVEEMLFGDSGFED